MKSLNDKEYLDLNQVCELLSITKSTANNWIRNKTLKPFVIDSQNMFLKQDIEALLYDLKEGKNQRLKSRRNKNYVQGSLIPKSYIQSKEGIETVEKIIAGLQENILWEGYDRVILAEYALKLLASRKMLSPEPQAIHEQHVDFTKEKENILLSLYLDNPQIAGNYAVLIEDLIQNVKDIQVQLNELKPVLSLPVKYLREQDFLGLLFMSLQNLGERKAKGVYYTPLTVVKDAVDWLRPFLNSQTKLLDPCCGTGNFLMYAYKYVDNLEGICGYDICPLSVAITRINMALVTKTKDIKLLYRNFICINPLFNESETKFDVIIGNPPWGFKFNSIEQQELKKRYYSAQATTVESFCVFAELALKSVKENGLVSLILPQALLKVKLHKPARKFLMDNCQIRRIRYWDNVFDGVQCPAITLTYAKSTAGFSVKDAYIISDQKSFRIAKERQVDSNNWNFDVTDMELFLLEKIRTSGDVCYLKNMADFALGIVTGDNKKYLYPVEMMNDHSRNELEPIYRGSEVVKYRLLAPRHLIKFTPELFQQVAPEKLYRAKEKLIYRFIGGNLVFAYDTTQALTLNSANILIPKIEGLEIKYILAVLNSRIAQYYFSRQFNSLKILRSQLESIPIPKISLEKQRKVIDKVDLIIWTSAYSNASFKEVFKVYEEIDEEVKKAYGLTEEEYEHIQKELGNINLFL